jgi:beta-galactosidase
MNQLNLRKSFIALVLFAASQCPLLARTTTSFDTGWRFLKTDAPGAEQPAFNDSSWRTLNVPHDWSIEGPFAQTNKTGGAGAFLPSGVGWYRKAFTLPESECVFVEFDGVMENSTVWINGVKLGQRPNGYVSFRYELTPHLKFGRGATNILAVRADTSAQPASRWYSGAGIYRHVRLIITEPIHIVENGVFISTPEVSEKQAVVRVSVSVTNKLLEPITVQTKLIAPNGKEIASVITFDGSSAVTKTGRMEQFIQQISITKPQLWDLANPKLYRIVTEIICDAHVCQGIVLDSMTNTFGIRDAQFTPEQGFVLNGKKVMLKGVCLHHDGGAFGAAVPLSVWERRLDALKRIGCNAIRTSHNPVAPEFLDLCDRKGFLVMDEFFDCWTVGKNREDYHKYFNEWSLTDLRDTVRRDRNHPSIIIYSAGNEIHDTPNPELAKRILAGLVKEYHENDPTRPVTQALFRPNVSHDYDNGLSDLLDVVGTNYRDKELLAAQKAKPERKIVGTEQRHDLETWLNCRDNPSHAGQFLWTGIDYLGESRQWPRNTHASGLLDRIGWEKPLASQRQSWWSDKPMVSVVRRVASDDLMPTDPGYGGEERHTQVTFADWSPRNHEPHPENIEVYSNCEEVELLLNGRSLGTQKKTADDSPRKWKVTFEPGELVAAGKDPNGRPRMGIFTAAGPATKVALSEEGGALTTAWDDVVFVGAYLKDASGHLVPTANDLVKFSISGPGEIVAVDNGDCLSTEPFQASERKAYGGRCVVIVRATADQRDITITATAAGLKPASAILKAGRQ